MLDCNIVVSKFELLSHNYIQFQINNFQKGKLADCSEGQPEGSFFNSYYSEV